MRYIIITTILLISTTLFSNAQVKRSLNQFEKGKYEAAFDILYKALEKDSINPEVKYIFSVFYLVDSFPEYSIDSSYFYITESIADFNTLNLDDIEKLQKDNFGRDNILLQKGSVEIAAFDSVKRQNTEEAYLGFLDKFNSSVREDSAILLRNQSAYRDASNTNSWNSYLSFMEKYPDANEFPQAKKNYQTLIYTDRTQDGKLISYERFLQDFPDTPFRAECENIIFRIRTGSHRAKDYIDFINSYPNSYLTPTVINRLFHLEDSDHDLIEDLTHSKSQIDSLNQIAKVNEGLLIPFLDNGNYGFYDSSFQPRIPAVYSEINANYFCGNIYQDVLQVSEEEATILVNRDNYKILENIVEFEDLGSGLLKYQSENGKYGVIQKSGEEILENKWDDIVLLNGRILAVNMNGSWGLYSVSNIQLIPLESDSIYMFNNNYVLESDRYHFYREEDILAALDQNEGKPFLSIDDFLVWDEERTIVFDGNTEGLLNSSGEMEIMLGNYRIEPVKEKTFLVQTDSSTYIFNPEDDDLSNLKWDQAKYNNNWLALKIKDKWYAENLTTQNHLKDIKDSVYFITQSILWTSHDSSDSLHFINGASIPFSEKSKYRVLVPKNKSEVERSYLYFFSKKENFLIDWKADTTLLKREFKPKDVSVDYLILEYKGKSGLYSRTGEELLEPSYDAIVSNGDGTLDLLSKRKFGLYRLSDSLIISADSDRKVRFFNDSLIITHSENQYFLKSSGDYMVYDEGFNEYKNFNDTTAFFRTDDQWKLVDIYNDSTLIENINNISLLSENENSNTFKILTGNGIGLLNDSNGLIIAPTFNEIINIGSYSNPFYIGEKYVSEADYYVLVYFDETGEIKHRYAYPMEVYDALMCDKTE